MTIPELNKALCGALEICIETRRCKYCDLSDSCPNLLAQVEVKCDKCGGTGRTATYHGNVVDGVKKVDSMGYHDCPCKGEPRLITLLQKTLEERGEWERFIKRLFEPCIRNVTLEDLYKDMCNVKTTLTDTYQLGRAVLEWLKEGK